VALDGPAGPEPLSAGPSRTVAFVTCTELLDLEPDDALAVPALTRFGVSVLAAAWDDPAVDWDSFDLAVLRSTWNYPPVRDAFVAWAGSVPRLANPAGLVAWNTDKRYLATLARSGVPVVPTTWIGPSDRFEPPAGDFVVKPAVGAGSVDAGRYQPSSVDSAVAHVARLQAGGRLVMVQPYLPAVDSCGETAMLYLGGTFSHAIRKGPLLVGPSAAVEGLYVREKITTRTPSAAERAVADAALAAVPPGDLLYARVDLIPGPSGEPLVVELELTEPSLFLEYGPGAAERFAAAIAARLRSA
jgi:glutathione synthase/RimK-type ligase-like ATP-grasp enzyme